MTQPVKLHITTTPFKGKDGEGFNYEGLKIVGTVKRGEEILHSEEVVADDNIESVCDAKDGIGLNIELWAVQNTDFMPEPENMPR